jgi:16S rRNA (guanine966-N2)-methyltransferase
VPALAALAVGGWLAPKALVSVEIGAREDFVAPDGFSIVDERRYGAGRLMLLSRS